MTQAIVTKYIGPSNTRGSRIKATAWAGSVTVPYKSNLSSEKNHAEAARSLAAKYGWHGKFVGGGMPGTDGFSFVNISAAAGEAVFTTYAENV